MQVNSINFSETSIEFKYGHLKTSVNRKTTKQSTLQNSKIPKNYKGNIIIDGQAQILQKR